MNHKIRQLTLRLQREQNRGCCGNNVNVIEDLRSELEETTIQRDLLCQRVVEMTHVLRTSDEQLEKSNARLQKSKEALNQVHQQQAIDRRTYYTAGLGFGAGAGSAVLLSLSSIPTIAAIAVGTITGIFLSESERGSKERK